VALLQARAKEIGEQAVKAPPAPHLVQGHEEQVRLLDQLQHRLAVSAARDFVAQWTRESLQHGCLQQELADVQVGARVPLP
jgi:hypothetical protein